MPPLSPIATKWLRITEVTAIVLATTVSITALVLAWPTGPEFPTCGENRAADVILSADETNIKTTGEVVAQMKCRKAKGQHLVWLGETVWNKGQVTHYMKGELYDPGQSSKDINLSGWPTGQQVKVQVYSCSDEAYRQLLNLKGRDPEGEIGRLPDECNPFSTSVTLIKSEGSAKPSI